MMPIMVEKKQLRAIVAKRLSRMTDATTHLVTETETIDEFVKRKNIKVWAEAEDLDVSGGKPIRERPEVGKLLSLEFLDEWDVLILYKLDRGFRNHLDFVTFYHEYCERYGKQIISVGEEGLDMSTNKGRMFAGILVQFAEWELHTISERRTKAMSVMRARRDIPGGHTRSVTSRSRTEHNHCQNRRNELKGTPQKCDKLGSVPQDTLDGAVSAKLLEVIGHYVITRRRLR